MLKKKTLKITVLLLFVFASSLLAGAGDESSSQDQENAVSKSPDKVNYTAQQEFFFDIFKKRRSVRAFKSTPVPKEHILKILEAARSAPTSGNQQPWKFLVVRDKIKLDEMKKACIDGNLKRIQNASNLSEEQREERRKQTFSYFDTVFSAPVYIVVLVDKKSRYPAYNRYDGPLAAGYLILAARALGYGTVFYTDSIPVEATQKVLAIPERYERVCITPVGVPKVWPDSPKKKALKEFVVFEKFVKGVHYKDPVERKAIKLDVKALQVFTGKYEFAPGVVLTITLENDKLFAQVTGQGKHEIFAESPLKFFYKIVDAQVTFVKDDKGVVTRLTLHQTGRDTPAEKID